MDALALDSAVRGQKRKPSMAKAAKLILVISRGCRCKLPLKTARKHPGRQQLPAGLARKEQIVVCPADECVCGKCGKETIVIGYETSEQLDVEPANYFVLVTKREKRAYKACEEQGVQTAPLPARIIDKGLASDRVIIDTIVSKYPDHLPQMGSFCPAPRGELPLKVFIRPIHCKG